MSKFELWSMRILGALTIINVLLNSDKPIQGGIAVVIFALIVIASRLNQIVEKLEEKDVDKE